ncbi:TPA: Tn3 family transposase, partial [Salmonella enterica subsp. enterica serovar Typhimurium]
IARAVFMHRLGEIRDRGLENQSYRASGLTLLTAAISLWNTVYIERAIDSLKRKGIPLNEQLISHLSPLGWEHINLSGDYVWRTNLKLGQGKYRSLRSVDTRYRLAAHSCQSSMLHDIEQVKKDYQAGIKKARLQTE